MRSETVVELKNNIDLLIKDGILQDKYLVVFGANAPNSIVINHLLSKEYNVSLVIDNSSKIQETYFMDILVKSPEDGLRNFNPAAIILIASQFYEEMKQQLVVLGYKENEHIFLIAEIEKKVRKGLDLDTFLMEKQKAERGRLIYNNIQNKYPNTLVIFSPYKANGDIYIICSYLNSYIKKLGLKKNDISITVIGKAAEKTARMFDYDKIITLDSNEGENFATFAKLYPDLVKMINPHYSHVQLYRKIDGYKDINFIDTIKYGLFELDNSVKPDFPIAISENNTNEFFDNLGLLAGKTVILAPHVHSLIQIRWTFWEKLSIELQGKGFMVCTNCGNESELPIKGTIPLYFDIRDTPLVLNKAGYLIAYRSGFCEVAATSTCKKIAIYPSKIHEQGFMSEAEYFSLDEEIYDGFIEIEHKYENIDILLKEVLAYFNID